MRINTMFKLLIAFYSTLVFLVMYGVYDFSTDSKEINEIHQMRNALASKCDLVEFNDTEKSMLVSSDKKFNVLMNDIQDHTLYIYLVMIIALVSFIITYIQLRKKILNPINEMNAVLLQHKKADTDLKEFESNNDEIGMMIKELFSMKKRLYEDYKEIEKLALTDSLTGILNRRAFFEISEQTLKLALRNEKSFSIMIIDIDFFKKVNDTYGHLIGDEVLKFLVQNVSSEIRDSDVFARYGGEEFIVMLPDTLEEGALSLAMKVSKSLEKNHYTDGNLTIPITISVGLATLKDEKLLRELIHRADEALYAAKENGRNRIEIH